MKILILTLNNASPKGGAEKLWRELANSLASGGHEVMVSVYSHQKEYHQKLLDPRISIHTRMPRRHGKSIFVRFLYYVSGAWLEPLQIKTIIQRCQPHCIFYSFGGFAELDNPRLLKVLNKQQMQSSAVFHSNTENYAFRADSMSLARKFVQEAKHIFLVSHRIGEVFKRQIGLYEFEYELIANPMKEVAGCDTSMYRGLNGPVKMAFIGTLDICVKGLGLMIQSMASPVWPNQGVQLDIYGEGKDLKAVQSLIDAFNLTDRVHLRGWVDDIDQIWETHQILVLPSFNEGMPMVIHEAMLRQRIVVATDVGGNSEIIEDGETGFLAPSACLKHLNEAFLRCFEKREKWEDIAKSARDSILEKRSQLTTVNSLMHKLES